MLGLVLQILTVVASLLTSFLLSHKEHRLMYYGYLIGLLSLPLWCLLEYHYEQWFYLAMNPFYIYCWFRGVLNHHNGGT